MKNKGLVALFLLCAVRCEAENLQEETLNSTQASYEVPFYPKNAFFFETFQDDKEFKSKWVTSVHESDKYQGEWQVEESADSVFKGDKGLVMKSRAKHHAISASLTEPFVFNGSSFVLQYEVKLHGGLECGGCYLKLLMQQPHLNLSQLNDRTPFVIMFGPDKCGTDAKVHFIFMHLNPISHKYEEKHARSVDVRLLGKFSDGLSHLYSLVIHSDNSFAISVDRQTYLNGNLLTDMLPAVNPSSEVNDPSDKKPSDWPQHELISDPEAVKPTDWDGRMGEMVVDVGAKVPEGWKEEEEEWLHDRQAIKPPDWDDEIDGVWEAALIANPACSNAIGCGEWTPPLIKNPHFKGQWKAPLVPNPAYKGVWKQRTMRNPDFFYDAHPYHLPNISALGMEVWSMGGDVMFDNILVTSSEQQARHLGNLTWQPKHQSEKEKRQRDSMGTIDRMVEAANQKPLLWIVIITSIVIPSLIVIIVCCRPPVKKVQDEDSGRRGRQRNNNNAISNTNNKVGHVISRSDKVQGQSSLRMRTQTKDDRGFTGRQ